MLNLTRKFLCSSSVGALLIVTAAQANAQEAKPAKAADTSDSASESSNEIIVTATKRETSVQETAISISVVGGDALQTRQITNIESLAQQLPGVNFAQTTGIGRISIRGIGLNTDGVGTEGRVAYHTDGVYISRPAAALAGFYDIERVEVLRGPQGTLYGRNATGGTINVITRKPTAELGGYLEASYGNYNAMRLEGAVGGPLADGVSARISFQLNERDGYGKNLTTNTPIDDYSTRALRGQLKLNPSDNFEVLLSADWFKQDDHAFGFHYLGLGSLPDATTTPPLTGATPLGLLLGGTVPTNVRDATGDQSTFNKRTFWGLGATMKLDLGAVEITSITGYRNSKFDILTDLDVTSAKISAFNQQEKSRQFSEELRFSGKIGGADWMIGGYYFNESLFGGVRIALDPVIFGAPVLTGLMQGYYAFGDLDTEAWAAFGNVSLPLGDRLTARIGARYSDERRNSNELLKFDFANSYPPFAAHFPGTPVPNTASWSSFTPSATLEYKANEDLFLYATYSRGFKSGGFNLGLMQAPYNPETLSSYEAGIRAKWLDGHLTTNLSAFYYDYKDMQVSKIDGTSTVIENAAGAHVKGLEAEITARPFAGLQIDAGISLLDAKFTNYVSADPARLALGPLNLSGNRPPYAPTYTINLGASETFETGIGEFTIRGEARMVDRVWGSAYNSPHVSQPAYELYNAFLTWKSSGGNLSATAFVRNIANKTVLSGVIVGTSLIGYPLIGSLEPPRTYGLTLGVKF